MFGASTERSYPVLLFVLAPSTTLCSGFSFTPPSEWVTMLVLMLITHFYLHCITLEEGSGT